MPYNCKLFVSRVVIWSYNSLRIISNYLKPYNCVQTKDYYWIEIITWKDIIISIW